MAALGEARTRELKHLWCKLAVDLAAVGVVFR